MKPIPIEVRNMIVAAKKRGEMVKTIALWTGFTTKSIYNIYRLYEENKLEAKPFPGRRSILTEDQLITIQQAINEQNDITLEELIEKLNLPIKKSRLSTVLIRMGLSFKKRLYTQKLKKDLML